jgi:hypothetical protein
MHFISHVFAITYLPFLDTNEGYAISLCSQQSEGMPPGATAAKSEAVTPK